MKGGREKGRPKTELVTKRGRFFVQVQFFIVYYTIRCVVGHEVKQKLAGGEQKKKMQNDQKKTCPGG